MDREHGTVVFPGMNFDPSIAAIIDHTILKADAARPQVLAACEEALRFGFAAVCVNSFWVPLVARELRGSPVKVCTVAGFPLGAASTHAKVAEVLAAIRDGAVEIDMVMNIGALKGKETAVASSDIKAIVAATHAHGAIVKVIIETALLERDEKIAACRLARDAGADFVKTSTGFASSGATADDLTLMRKTVGPAMGVKASGGIRSLEELRAMVAAGANRVGASASVHIMEQTAMSRAAT